MVAFVVGVKLSREKAGIILLAYISYCFARSPRPFDRHDWYVGRCGQQRRYVIDYYEGPEDAPGVPVFYLDVRPALDDPESILCRLKAAAKEKWEEWFPSKEASA